MQNYRDYYAILGLTVKADEAEIKRAFRQLARQCHPDLNPGDQGAEERFKDLSEAYEVLSDPERRAKYDQFSRYWHQGEFSRDARSPRGDRDGLDRGGKYGQFPDFDTFVDDLLGEPVTLSTRNAQTDGSPVNPSRPRSVARSSPGPSADGVSAAGVSSSPQTARPSSTAYPFQTPSTQAPVTQSSRQSQDIEARLTLPLEKAFQGGRERIRLDDGRALEVDMPAGMVTGQQILLRGQGNQGGDLYLRITVLPHAYFQLDGVDIHYTLAVTPAEAALGARIEVPTLDGLVTLALPGGTQGGQRLRLAQKGYIDRDGARGDQILTLQIVIPKSLTPMQKDLYQALLQEDTLESRSPLS